MTVKMKRTVGLGFDTHLTRRIAEARPSRQVGAALQPGRRFRASHMDEMMLMGVWV